MSTEYSEEFLCHQEERYDFGSCQRAPEVRGWRQVLPLLLTRCPLWGKKMHCWAPHLPVQGWLGTPWHPVAALWSTPQSLGTNFLKSLGLCTSYLPDFNLTIWCEISLNYNCANVAQSDHVCFKLSLIYDDKQIKVPKRLIWTARIEGTLHDLVAFSNCILFASV